MEILMFLGMLATGEVYGNFSIEQYCDATFSEYGAQQRCRRLQKSAEQEMLGLSYPNKPILDYCKDVIGPPAWQDIRACYKNQLKFKKKYQGLAKTRAEKSEKCDAKHEAQNWMGKAHCISPGAVSFRTRDAYNLGLRDTFINR